MSRRSVAVLIVGLAAVASGCGSSESASTPTTGPPAVIASALPDPGPGDGVGGIGDAVEVAADAPAQADDASCAVDRQTLETAAEVYLGLNGTLPQSQNALLEAQLIREPSPRFEITAEGMIVPAPGSTCP